MDASVPRRGAKSNGQRLSIRRNRFDGHRPEAGQLHEAHLAEYVTRNDGSLDHSNTNPSPAPFEPEFIVTRSQATKLKLTVLHGNRLEPIRANTAATHFE